MNKGLNQNSVLNGKSGLNINLPTDVCEFFKQKRVLVTGGTGMIGRQVIKLLKTANCEITCVSLDDLSWDDGVKYFSLGWCGVLLHLSIIVLIRGTCIPNA